MHDSDKKLLQLKDIRYKPETGMFAVVVSQSHGGLRMSQDGGARQLGPDFNGFDADGEGFVTPNDLERVAPGHATVGPSRLTDILLRIVALAIQSIVSWSPPQTLPRRPLHFSRGRSRGFHVLSQ